MKICFNLYFLHFCKYFETTLSIAEAFLQEIARGFWKEREVQDLERCRWDQGEWKDAEMVHPDQACANLVQHHPRWKTCKGVFCISVLEAPWFAAKRWIQTCWKASPCDLAEHWQRCSCGVGAVRAVMLSFAVILRWSDASWVAMTWVCNVCHCFKTGSAMCYQTNAWNMQLMYRYLGMFWHV